MRPTFVCDLESLTRLLKHAAEAVQTNRNLLHQYKSTANGEASANRGGKGGRIPKKARFADKGDKEPGEVLCLVNVARSGSRTSRTPTGPRLAKSLKPTAHVSPAEAAVSVGVSGARKGITILLIR